MFKILGTIIITDLKTILRDAFSWLSPLLFFMMIITLYPLTLGPALNTLQTFIPSILWIAVLLAILLSMNHLFRVEKEEGLLELFILSQIPLTLLILCKLISHWLTHCLPLIILCPLLGLLFNLSAFQEFTLIFSLLLGTPTLVLIGGIGAALVVSIRGHGLLLPILIIPLYIPILIFGTNTLIAANTHQPFLG